MISKILKVSDVNRFIKMLLDTNSVLKNLTIEGEVSNFVRHGSGHLYFTLKDNQSKIDCVMFKNQAEKINFPLSDGLKIMVKGSLSVYEKSGVYQVYVKAINAVGEGQLYLLYEALKQKLLAQGYFNNEIKKELPENIESVGVITSITGAAVQDIISVIKRRNPTIKLKIFPAIVQGENAVEDIINGIEYFNGSNPVDVIILGRGGGSIEDLWSFNEEAVAIAIFNSNIPIISAVGHETDFTISDFVADLRAPTPSVAAELVSTPLELENQKIVFLHNQINAFLLKRLNNEKTRLKRLGLSIKYQNPQRKIEDQRFHLDNMDQRIKLLFSVKIKNMRLCVNRYRELIEAYSPTDVLRRGYTIIKDSQKNIIKSYKSVDGNSKLKLIFYDGEVNVNIKE